MVQLQGAWTIFPALSDV